MPEISYHLKHIEEIFPSFHHYWKLELLLLPTRCISDLKSFLQNNFHSWWVCDLTNNIGMDISTCDVVKQRSIFRLCNSLLFLLDEINSFVCKIVGPIRLNLNGTSKGLWDYQFLHEILRRKCVFFIVLLIWTNQTKIYCVGNIFRKFSMW